MTIKGKIRAFAAGLGLLAGMTATAQDGITTFGIQYKPIIPVAFLRSGPTRTTDGAMTIEMTPKFGNSIGMAVRYGINSRFSFDGGINLVHRNFSLVASTNDTTAEFHHDFKWVSYEVPMQLLVFIRLGEHLYLNASGGISLDFFPSDVGGYSRDLLYVQRTYRRNRLNVALLGNFGTEWRTESAGIFYLGASYHQPFTDMAFTRVQYAKDIVQTFINGSYLTLDFRYFFHEDPKR